MFNVRYLCYDCRKASQTAPGRTVHALVRHRTWMTGATIERAFNRDWGDLAQYNADRERGYVPPKDIAERMAEKQRRYDREVLGLNQDFPSGLPVAVLTYFRDVPKASDDKASNDD